MEGENTKDRKEKSESSVSVRRDRRKQKTASLISK